MGTEATDIAIIGAGAAGLMAAIAAGRALVDRGAAARVVAFDGARTLGAKILVAGGGRCNVTHHAVDESAYAGSSKHAIRHVLRAFDVPRTTAFFAELGVELKREPTGKLFPVTDDAHTVLDALIAECRRLGVQLRHPCRVTAVTHDGADFVIEHRSGSAAADAPVTTTRARRVILATGGMALPRSGSDGAGYAFAKALGHTVTPRVFPALVPLKLPDGHWIRELSGLTLWTTIELRAPGGKRLQGFTNSMLCTHFGLSGPGVLDISRYYTEALGSVGGALVLNWLPGVAPEALDAVLLEQRRRSPLRVLAEHPWPPPKGPDAPTAAVGLPERLARALCVAAGVDPSMNMESMSREGRRALVQSVTATPLPITGDRGFTFAEVTAGGVPLSEVHTSTMESRVRPGLHVIGELCDVDGRIGGFNFQWAWASGYLAGSAAANAIDELSR